MLEVKFLEKKKSADGLAEMKRYQIGRYLVNVEDEEGRDRYIEARPDYSKGENFLPDIHIEREHLWKGKAEVKVGTTSYGSLNVEDIQKVIAGYNEAIEVAQIIKEKFL